MIHLCAECKKTCNCRFDGKWANDECQWCVACNDAEDERDVNDPVFMAALTAAYLNRHDIARVLVDPQV